MKDKQVKKTHIKISAKKLILIIALIWLSSIFGTWYFTKKLSANNKNGSEFSLLNPRLKTLGLDTREERSAKLFATLIPLKDQLLSYLGEKKENTAFYVEDLNTGSWTGWKERDPFIAASLLKVPASIAVMKKIDSGEWTLDTTFSLEEKNKDNKFGELWKMETGTKLTVKQLLEEMLQNSDNTAVFTFLDQLTAEELDNVYYHIGATNPDKTIEMLGDDLQISKLSAKDLASTFRALYNATYLTRKSSNYILDLLTKTRFDEVVPINIPKDVPVAHKIANFFNKDPNRPKEYHDCGIVYYPDHPYLFCTMTDGYDAAASEKIIVDMGNKTYEYFEKNGKLK